MAAPSPSHVPEAWPLLLSREQLCAYLGVCAATLAKVCPVAPLDLGANVVRYSRPQIDAWAATLPPRLPGLRLSQTGGQDAAPAQAAQDEPGEGLSAAERAVARATARAKGGVTRWKKTG